MNQTLSDGISVRRGCPCIPGKNVLSLGLLPRPARLATVFLVAGLVWAGGSAALTLGNLEIRSTLGQPLEALVRVDAAAGEAIRNECFSAGASFAALPDVPRIDEVQFRLQNLGGQSVLRIASRLPVKEPVAQIVLQVRCPGLPNLSRSFLVMLDPISSPIAEIAVQPYSLSAGAPNTASARLAAPRSVSSGAKITPGSRYVVRPGDTLSGIASRIANRPSYSVWPLAEFIFRDNPGAFENRRADKLITGSQIRIPDAAIVAGSAGRRTGTDLIRGTTSKSVSRPSVNEPETGFGSRSENRIPDRQVSRRPAVIIGTPVQIGSGTARNVDIDYLVLTPALSALSLARIGTRAATTESVENPEPAPTVEIASKPVEAATENNASLFRWWPWLLVALGAVLAGGLLAVFFRRGRKTVSVPEDKQTPWEMDSSSSEPVRPMVYDDFEGTFVPANPSPEVSSAKDPEDEILTNLMPALGNSTVNEPARQSRESETGQSGNNTDKESLSFEIESTGFRPVTLPDDPASHIKVRTFDSPDEDKQSPGWVNLDFEATQILEQDYLAEYAATLKEKINENNVAPDSEQVTALNLDDEDDEVLLDATDLMEALDEGSADSNDIELARQDGDFTSELPALDLVPESDDDTRALPTIDDNVVAIESGKKTPVKDDDGSGKRAKSNRKKS